MKKVWIFLLIAVVLIAWTLVRERFEPTPSIQAPPYDKEDKIRIFGLLNSADQAYLMAPLKAQDPTNASVVDTLSAKPNLSTDEKAKLKEVKEQFDEKAGGLMTPTIEAFYTEVYKPATVPITSQKIDTFLTTDTNTLVTKEILKRILTSYFISQGGISSNSAYNSILTGLGQGQGYVNNGPAGAAAGGTTGGSAGGASAGAAGAAGAAAGAAGAAAGGTTGGSSNPAGAAAGAAAGGTTGGSTSNTTGGTTGGSTNTTGGSSNPAGGAAGGSSGGSSGRLNRLFGPLFSGFGTSTSGKGLVDSTKGNKYPELLGGGGKNSTSNAQSFAPGDMEMIPDPYRVSQQFASSSYSFKTEPVPFLTDFSAFQR